MAVRGSDYYDIILLGKTGKGKSTTGNKLLQVESHPESDFINLSSENGRLSFLIPDSEEDRSVTEACNLVANVSTKVRVLDTRGFSQYVGDPSKGISTYDENLKIFLPIVRELEDKEKNIRVRRVLYFLPERGVPERADGALQDELKLMDRLFGNSIFNYMVIIATNSKQRKYQLLGFDQDDIAQVQKVFQLALKRSIDNDIKCPPVVYIGVEDKDDEILLKIKEAPVLVDKGFLPKFPSGICSRCSAEVKCNSEGKPAIIVENEEGILYEESKCHPIFIDKSTTEEKATLYIATLGAALVVEAAHKKLFQSRPGFSNSNKKCAICSNSPGSPGCLKISAKVKLTSDDTHISFDHHYTT